MAQTESRSLGDKLQSIPKPFLYLVLIIVTTVPLLIPGLSVPNKPSESAIDFYASLMKIPDGSTILIGTDWTNSTRGESGGEFQALIRILMSKHIKFAFYSTGDAQAPRVARTEMAKLNLERKAAGRPEYQHWNDWISLGYFPNSEGTNTAIGANARKAFAGRQELDPTGRLVDVFQSPVLNKIQQNSEIPLLVLVTASNTNTITIGRIYGHIPLSFMVTGVMGPESQVNYQAHQIVGLVTGLKGVYDLEILMRDGTTLNGEKIPPVPGAPKGMGSVFYPTLHFALALLILAVIVGNIGMFLSRKRGAK